MMFERQATTATNDAIAALAKRMDGMERRMGDVETGLHTHHEETKQRFDQLEEKMQYAQEEARRAITEARNEIKRDPWIWAQRAITVVCVLEFLRFLAS